MIRVADFPQLKLIAWNRDENHLVSGQIALALYERNWRYVDQASLTSAKKELIERLVREHGNGVLLV